ncbi:class I SAM-dependent methyltransferase [bacterium]|nr:MAG: class I SAM-dependent methyltransferase [bacterium]QQR62140.1 MAG: class I SAM-dependent methyltransferase [bacterium]QQR63303.1 MAG: class I SAM-dependent methyltransferase [bacterium]
METDTGIDNNLFSVNNLYEPAILSRWLPTDERPENVERIKEYCLDDSSERVRSRRLVENNGGDSRFYGVVFPSLPAIQYAYLARVRTLAQDGTSPICVHFGEADGRVAFKARLACGDNGTIIVNDLSVNEIKKAKRLFTERSDVLNKSMNNVQFDAGSLFEFVNRQPHLAGKVDVCYIQNVEHFMNPREHQHFVALVKSLLKPQGHIFATAHTIESSDAKKGDPYFDQYMRYKEDNNPYPLFAKIKKTIVQDLQTRLFVSNRNSVVSVERPAEDCICEQFSEPIEFLGNTEVRLMQNICTNRFTPTIYKNAFGDSFECVESFFMDTRGNGFKTYKESPQMSLASYIGKKKS